MRIRYRGGLYDLCHIEGKRVYEDMFSMCSLFLNSSFCKLQILRTWAQMRKQMILILREEVKQEVFR